ncbi:MAG TPA: ABC transporter permease [Gemmatimonadaceae bacterium]|nr:ABC transporter permease [Gemmatimonadaceae bacterium]
MNFRAIAALLKASFLTASSYRVRFIQALVTSLVTVVPVFFVARALQPMMGPTIQAEGKDFFAFLIVGFVVMSFVVMCVDSLPTQVSGDINNGFFEALLGAPVGTPTILVGLVAYPVLFTVVRGAIMLALAAILGVNMSAARLPEVALVVALLAVAHFGIALVATGLMVAFRTTLSIPQLVIAASGFLGGVYWPTSVIPSWVYTVSEFVPMTYGLRAIRQAVLEGRALPQLKDDVLMLAAFAGCLLSLGILAMTLALAHARRRGTLSQY